MPESACPTDHDLLALAVREPVPLALHNHLRACPECGRRLQRLLAEVEDLRQAQRHTPLADFSTIQPVHELESTGPFPAAPAPAGAAAPQPARAAAPPPPRTIGKYPIVTALDAGGQALVFRARHPTLDKDLVIKLDRQALAGDSAERALLVAEGRLLADLDHPHLVRVYDLDFHEDHPFLVMDFVRGCNLQQHVGSGRLPPRQAALLLAKVARALGLAHRRGIVHRDLKPHNILIDEAGEPRLIDFGMALQRHAWLDTSRPAGEVSGTPAYMAPEQARGDSSQVDRRSDLFALGGVLYFLLTGQAPFHGRDVYDALDRAGRCDFDRDALRAPGIPRRLAAVCLRALAAEPAERHAQAEDFAADLESYAAGTRSVRLLAGAAVVFLVIGLGLTWWLRSGKTPAAAPDAVASPGKQDPPRDSGPDPKKAAVPPEAAPTPVVLRPILLDDFQIDSRADYQANNAVRWEKGKLLLGPDASLSRPIQAGSVVELTAKLAFPPLMQDGDEAETRVGFTIENAGVVAGVVFFRRRDQGKETGEIRILSVIQTGDKQHARQTHDQFPWPPRPAVEEWQILFQYGVIEVRCAGQRLALGCIESGAIPLVKLRWAQTLGQSECHGLTVRAVAPPPPLTPAQRKELDEASRANDQAVALSKTGKDREAIHLAQRAYDLRKQVLGEQHHDTMLSLVNLGAMLEKVGALAQARPYYEQALKTYRAVLGNWHPDTAWVLSNFGDVLRQQREFPAARQCLEEALNIYKEVMGPEHPDSIRTLENLALLLKDSGDQVGAARLNKDVVRLRKGMPKD